MSKNRRLPHSSPPQQQDAQPMDEGLIKQFLENQGKQLEFQVHQLRLQEKQLEQSHELAKESMKYQSIDREQTEKNSYKRVQTQYIFWGAITVCFLILLGVTICLNKEQMALEILKVIVPAIVSAVGSYFYGFHKGAEKKENESYTPYEEVPAED
ncbi:hypothetical protein [Chitinophaga sp.]|uniref:hypothetical protein n=1 Tax=Chitinophaga sp. TaxID=1869181 RepID=UPI0031DE1FBA